MDIRHVIRLIMLASLMSVVGVADAGEKAGKRILLIGVNPDHPHGTHMYMHAARLLGCCVERTPGVETAVSNGWPRDVGTLKGVNTIVVYSPPAAELLLDGEHRGQFDALMRSGCGLVTLHWASSVRKENLDRLGPTWLSYLGGTWVSSVGLSGGNSALKQLIPDHPVCRGWKEWEIDDEYYLDPTIADAKPLLRVTERGGKDVIVGWVFDRPGGGRSFATTLGHFYANFENESFRRMVVNGILWTAGIDVPREGAVVDVPPEVLGLPPQGK